MPNGDSLLAQDGSAAAYFELGHYSIDVYPLVDSLAKAHGEKVLPSKEGRPLCAQKCLNLYNSKELESFIIKMDNELNIKALKK